MKIIAVGMNYVAHCHELHADEKLPEEPVIFMKPDSALLKDSKPFFIPDFSQQVDYETELVVRINRLGKNIAPRFASRYYDAVTVGIDFTARDLQRRFREEGKPWELCKGFDSSAAIGDFECTASPAKAAARSMCLLATRHCRRSPAAWWAVCSWATTSRCLTLR